MSAYPFDPTGLALTNRIVGETHTLTDINANPYKLFIPDFAPFYLDNFKLYYVDNLGNLNELTEGVDFHLTLPYLAATRSIGKMLYGGVSITNLQLSGTYRLNYQSIGGDWVSNVTNVLQNIVNNNYNPRIVSWDVITNVQTTFPPINHNVDLNQLKGYEDLINSLGDLAGAITSRPQPMFPLPASQAQVNTGLDNITYVTPLTLKKAVGIGSSSSGGVAPHTHAEADIVSLTSDLANKADSVHNHGINNIINLQSTLDNKAALVHSHSSADVSGLNILLDAKASVSHVHTKAEVGLDQVDNTSDINKPVSNAVIALINNLQTQITNLTNLVNTKANISHTHTISQITDIGSLAAGIGLNTVTDMTARYTRNTDIINDQGDMFISYTGASFGTVGGISITVNGNLVAYRSNHTNVLDQISLFAFIPNGATFNLASYGDSPADQIHTWTRNANTH